MIYLTRNTSNTVVLELTSNTSILNPYYVFEFTSDIYPNNTVKFTANDQSNFKCRYNLFTLTETGSTSVNLLNGIINLKTGSYTYNIYQMSNSATTINDLVTTGKTVDTGKVIVVGTDYDLNPIYR